MFIRDLLSGVSYRWLRGEDDVDITAVTHDSRRAAPGAVFVAVEGVKEDGSRFAPDALARGAAAVVIGPRQAGAAALSGAARLIEVEDQRIALAVMARNLHGRVDETLRVVGVTGTNGKTTTCSILASILESAGIRTGLLGTVSYRVGDEEIPAERTTPEATDIHRYLASMSAAGCGACVMEVSSHSLDLARVHAMKFAVAVFTNLTRDHLDHHRDMERYYRAKATLFDGLEPPAVAVVNLDDPYGVRLASELGGRDRGRDVAVVGYGSAPGATIRLTAIESDEHGCRVMLSTPEGEVGLASSLLGRPNGYNVTAAATAARAMGIGWERIEAGVAAARRVPGRMEPVTIGGAAGARQRFTVVVDYAHTDDALRGLLETAREMTQGRLIVVFGCGGDRDRSKRSLMGGHAARLADLVFVTSDNPRGERPESIIEEILAGMQGIEEQRVAGSGRIRVDPDRGKAIEAAIGAARPGDTVVIAGKGHETQQIIGDRVVPFDDRDAARAALEKRLGEEGADVP